jgi:hemoglobin-like flavoprotein
MLASNDQTPSIHDSDAMTPNNPIEHTFELAAARCEDLTPLVYRRLFRQHPEAESLFRREPGDLVKGSMLALAIDALLDFAGDRRGNFRMIGCEVQSHDAYGTPRELFVAFFDVIARTLREILGPEWSPEIDGAWRKLLAEIDGVARFKTRLEHIDEPQLRRIVTSDIKRLKARKAAQTRHIAKHLRAHDDLAKRLDLVLSIPGIGERTALALIIRMPELGQISREEAAALAGLAPFDDDSGKYKGQRHIAGGRGRLRRSIFAAALPAAFRWNQALIALYGRLIAKGKAHNAALIACARKLLIYANTVVQRGTPWIEKAA